MSYLLGYLVLVGAILVANKRFWDMVAPQGDDNGT